MQFKDLETYNKINKIARDILRLSRNTLMVNLRFLDMALSRLHMIPLEGPAYATDGLNFAYDPKHVIERYRTESEAVTRDYLHVVMHCIFQHMFVNTLVDQEKWDLACDIAVENAITELGLRSTTTTRESGQANMINRLKGDIQLLTAEKIYRYLLDKNTSSDEIARLNKVFKADDHAVWYMRDKSEYFGDTSGDGDGEGSEQSDNNGSGSNQTSDSSSDNSSEDSNEASQVSRSELEQTWKDISERVQQDLETFSKERGAEAGGFVQNLKAVNREKYDYTSFLKKFAVLGEAMVINDDEFDYIFYTYGLKLYKNMPLIEPLEYKEVKRIKEFVIAIDTSGSTSGDLVQKFLQKTYNILKSTESFFSKVNIHIIQCDAEIQEHVKITNQEEFDEYLKNMKILGLGGTDFRPVFNLVDGLIEADEFSNLKGLIYFTDGYGVFPNKKPDYDTAFVFIEDNYGQPEVPPWAIKLVLQSEEI